MSHEEDRRMQEIMEKAILKVTEDYLEKKLAQVGRWTVSGFLAIVMMGLIYIGAWLNGWHKSG